MDLENYHRENGAAWDITAAIYERDEQRDINFLRAGGSSLLPPEQAALGDLAAWCRRAIHLQCAGGTDTLSLLKQGAAEVVGIDISPRMIACARRKTAALSAPASWVCCDVLAAPEELSGSADLVHTGRGALNFGSLRVPTFLSHTTSPRMLFRTTSGSPSASQSATLNVV